MSQVVIGDILPYTQATAILNQIVFGTNWTANAASDVVVYVTPAGDEPDDVLQILQYPSEYSVAFIGAEEEVEVTLVTPSAAGDIVTITRQTPADRENLYSNTNFTPSMLNNDFGILTLVDQQAQLVDQKIGPRYNYSAVIVDVVDTILPILGANETWVKNPNNDAIIPYTLPASGIAPADATYVTVTDETATLPNSVNFNGMSAGIVAFTGAGFVTNPVAGTTDEIDIANPTGVSGSVTISLADDTVIPGTGAMGVPSGTTAQRVITGQTPFRYNSTLDSLEFYSNGTWSQISDNTDGIVLPGLQNDLAYYATTGTTVSGITLSGLIDTVIGSTQGNILYRNATIWTVLAPGASGQVLTSGGAAANVSWTSNGSGTVTSIATNNGLTGGTITTSGTIGLAAIADHTLLANISGGPLAPSSTTLTALIDNAIGSTQGNILYRNATVWTVLAPGVSGQFLQSLGAGANIQWAPGDGAGTVTSITAGAGITLSPSPITSSGSVSVTPGQIPGTTTNDNATAGNVGEVVTSNITSGSAISVAASGNSYNITSISLTAGDWDVVGNVLVTGTASTLLQVFQGGISSTSATLPNGSLRTVLSPVAASIQSFDQGAPVPPQRISLASTTTIYLVVSATFTISTLNAYGNIIARRRR